MKKESIYIMLLFFFSLSFISCKSQSVYSVKKETVVPDNDSIFATLDRSPCFGKCPAFSAIIFKTGDASYEGHSSVERLGLYKGKVTIAQMKKLSLAAENLRLDTLQNEYINPHIADFPSHSFSIVIKDHRKEITIMDTEAPSTIDQFEKFLEQVLEDVKWVRAETKP